ncbi:MAG: long-chain-fatty-acid--CoA ligase [Actinobacteria bacterium]|nr:long-chain-fatty-acid--CoA ligase [Actinomycetota bacterium]
MATAKRKTVKKTTKKSVKRSAKKSTRKAAKKKTVKKTVKKSTRKLAKKKSPKKSGKKTVTKSVKKRATTVRNPLHAIKDVGGILRYHAKKQPNAVSLVLGERTLTWAQLLSRSAQVAQGLKRAGVKAQDRVAFLDKNGMEHFEVFYGCALLNAVSVDVNWRLAAPEVLFIVNDSQAEVLIVGQEFVPVLDAIISELSLVKTIIVIGGHSDHDDYERWVNAQSATDPKAPTKSSDVAFQLYSSGTTGRPKGVMLTNDNYFTLLPAAQKIWLLSETTINLVAMPLFHIGGGGWATAAQYCGARSIIMRDVNPAEIVAWIEKYRITHAFMVPALLQFALSMPNIATTDFSSLELIVYGASPISEAVLESAIKAFKCPFMQVYGLTETTGVVTVLGPEDHDLSSANKGRLRSCGKPFTGIELRIVDSDTAKDVPLGEVGEIWIRSRQVMKGYWNMPEETAKSIVKGRWFRSGDAGYFDKDGYVYIFDRVKDMIVSGGENVYPAEVENALMAHPAIADVAVIGVPDEKWGEVPMALVVRKPDTQVTENEILTFARERLAGFKTPKTVGWVEVLPRNPSGKILKKDLREPYWKGHTRRVN